MQGVPNGTPDTITGRRNLPEPERIKYALELKPAIAALAEARMKAGTKQDPVSNLTQGKTRDVLADKAGVSIGKFHYAETLLTKAPDFLREWYETGVVTAHGGYQLYRALEGAHEGGNETRPCGKFATG